MTPKWHILIGFSVSIILVQFFNFSLVAGLTIFLSSFLIDLDHYLKYGFSKKDWNVHNATRWHFEHNKIWKSMSKKERNQTEKGVFVFHSLPLCLLFFALGFWNTLFHWILIGMIIHLIADYIVIIYLQEAWYSKLFPCYVMISNKNKKPFE